MTTNDYSPSFMIESILSKFPHRKFAIKVLCNNEPKPSGYERIISYYQDFMVIPMQESENYSDEVNELIRTSMESRLAQFEENSDNIQHHLEKLSTLNKAAQKLVSAEAPEGCSLRSNLEERIATLTTGVIDGITRQLDNPFFEVESILNDFNIN